jgi:threonine synthase
LSRITIQAKEQKEKFRTLPFGSIKPSGWLKTQIQKDIEGFSLSDDETKNTMKKVYSEKKYMLDPHSAIAYSALERKNKSGVFLATAHPAKFKDVVEETLQTKISLPDQLKQVAKKEKSAVFMPADFKSFKDYLLK